MLATKNDRLPLRDCLLLPLGALLATMMIFMIEYTTGRGLIQSSCRGNATTTQLMHQHLSTGGHGHGHAHVSAPFVPVTDVMQRPHVWDIIALDDDGHDAASEHSDHDSDVTPWIWHHSDDDDAAAIPEWWTRSEVTIIPRRASASRSAVSDARALPYSCIPCDGMVFVTSVNDTLSLASAHRLVTSIQQYASQCPILIHYHGIATAVDMDHDGMIVTMAAWNNVVVLLPSWIAYHHQQSSPSSPPSASSPSLPSLSRLRPWIIYEAFQHLKQYRTISPVMNDNDNDNDSDNDERVQWPWSLPYACESFRGDDWYRQLRVIYMDHDWRLQRGDLMPLLQIISDTNATVAHTRTHGAFYVPVHPRSAHPNHDDEHDDSSRQFFDDDDASSSRAPMCALTIQGYHVSSPLLTRLFDQLPVINSTDALSSLREQELDPLASCNDDQWYWQPFMIPSDDTPSDVYQHVMMNHRRAYDIIIPYISSQIPRVTEQFDLWDTLLPCDIHRPLSLHMRPNLYLFNSRSLLPSLRIDLTELFYAHDWSHHCFNELRFADCDLNGTLDSHPYGPNQQFIAIYHSPLFADMRRTTNYFFLMEPDTFPIRSGWMTSLYRETTDSNDGNGNGQWWGKGTNWAGNLQSAPLDYRLHMNGNGIWSTSSTMGDYVTSIYESPWCPGWDHELFCYITHQPAVYHRVMHRWRYTTFILNMWHINWNSDVARHASPSTTFIHGKQRNGITESK